MGSKPVMLVADDVEMNRMILRSIFVDEFDIIEAENGLKVLEILYHEQGNVDIILLDIQMPLMDGYEVLEKLKSDPEYSKIPVITNTQFDNEDNEIKALKLGAIEFISKPYNPSIIRQRVHNVLEKTVLEHLSLQKSLDDSNIKLQSLIDSVPGGIAICKVDDKLEFQYYNDTYCAISGLTKEEFTEMRRVDSLARVYEEDKPHLIKIFKHAVKNDTMIKTVFRIKRKDGGIAWVSLTAAKYKEEMGVPVYHMVLIDVTDEKKKEEQLQSSLKELRFRTERDTLTGIYNREMFVKMVNRLFHIYPERKYVIIYSDIANFKMLNELSGTETGDKLLKYIAVRLKRWIRLHGIFGRWGADNFAALLPLEVYPMNQICNEIERLLNDIKNTYNVMMYFGIYHVSDIKLPVNQMCDRASMALKTIKGSFNKSYAFYDDQLRNNLHEEQEIVSEMEQALANHEFCAYFQPIYSAKSAQPVSAEALVRWNHPQKGLISPAKFIPIFEKTGFITKLDYYIWEYTCRYISEQMKAGENVVPISVNVSRRNLYNPGICDNIFALVDKYGLTPKMLKLEITETAYNDNPIQLSNMVKILREKGFYILMDDFGSGYSSLNMLKDLPVDILKIDMKFMEDLIVSQRANNVITSIVQMAKMLNMNVVAEGVETEEQLSFLKTIGCDMIQGYYYSKPIPADEFSEKLQHDMK